jgi:iron complex outermembrane recepter protein
MLAARSATFGITPALTIAIAFACAPTLMGQTTPTMSASQLKKLSLEDLANIEVTSVSRRVEKLSDAAAAVEVISAERIERSAATQLPDALRLATGLDVAQATGRSWAISSRGFANTTANKMEVLLDGRSLYSPLYSGVFWDVQDTFIADLARIEVIRGPGAVQWGANAVNGVINIISKPAVETQGSLVRVNVGTEQRGAMVRKGGNAGKGHYRVYAQSWFRDELRTPADGSGGDARRLTQVGGRMDLPASADDQLTVQGDVYQGRERQVNLSPIEVWGGNLLSRWSGAVGANDRASVQFYYDRTQRDSPRQFSEIRDTFDLQGQREFHFSTHTIVGGVHARVSADRIGNTTAVQFLPNRSTTRLYSIFAQDEIMLPDPRWRVILGSTLEHNSFTGMEVQPTARIAFTGNERWMAWGAYSHAVRTPSRIDRDLFSQSPNGQYVLIGNRAFDAERLEAMELGGRWHRSDGTFADLALFHNRYDRLRSQEPVGPRGVPFTLGNRFNGRATGLELALTHRPFAEWQLKVGWREMTKVLWPDSASGDRTGGASEGNDPRRILTLHSSFDLSHDWRFDAVIRHASRRPAPAVPATTEADLRLAWQASRDWELGVFGRNLLHHAHREFGAAGPAARELARTVEFSVTWRR